MPCAIARESVSGAFPQWIGHSREALGEAVDSAEAWHGEIVQTILWQRLGLLVRDANGCYHVLHQILRDYLAGCWAENERRLRLRRVRVGVAARAGPDAAGLRRSVCLGALAQAQAI